MILVDTLHPIHEGRAFRWEKEKPEATLTEYGRTAEGEAAERWRTSPLYRLLNSGESLLRLRVTARLTEFLQPRFRESKFTDYVAIINHFAGSSAISRWIGIDAIWMTTIRAGFSDDEIRADRLTPFLELTMQSRVARTSRAVKWNLSRTRRGPAGAERPHQTGRRGEKRIKTVLWFSDLRNYAPHLRNLCARRNHSAAQRLRRGVVLIDPPALHGDVAS